jgi:hypothetical protein
MGIINLNKHAAQPIMHKVTINGITYEIGTEYVPGECIQQLHEYTPYANRDVTFLCIPDDALEPNAIAHHWVQVSPNDGWELMVWLELDRLTIDEVKTINAIASRTGLAPILKVAVIEE